MAWRGALSKSLQELRIHICNKGAASQGARDFLLANYAEIKKANPGFPVLVREATGAEAKLIARYDFGVEQAVSIQGESAGGVAAKLEQLVKSAPKA